MPWNAEQMGETALCPASQAAVSLNTQQLPPPIPTTPHQSPSLHNHKGRLSSLRLRLVSLLFLLCLVSLLFLLWLSLPLVLGQALMVNL